MVKSLRSLAGRNPLLSFAALISSVQKYIHAKSLGDPQGEYDVLAIVIGTSGLYWTDTKTAAVLRRHLPFVLLSYYSY